MTRYFVTKDRTPLAEGRVRRIYRHPDHGSWLVKVLRPEISQSARANRGSWWRGTRPLGPHSVFLREINEYVASHANDPSSLDFTQKVIGLLPTDLGIGIVVEAECDRAGNLAPTTDQLIRRGGFDATAQHAMARFINALMHSPLVVSDLHWSNLVYSYSVRLGERFVIIDGLGIANPIPLKACFPILNRRSKQARIDRLKQTLARELGLESLIEELRP
ncbi:MAG: hypothetical protein FJ385_08395 [Verrucomicrobia bacterium]|nr:hypothetical protein [Verrucomicrobiota bacterium]